ncbi:hypothetical protein AB1Y20_000110 [Prymnesium parvum]|uniref:FAD dependent oxidoreductase domain-containing protein n=1 Tax=Prymnesium parvum TaxID=97485 RepID=A0AB34K819_PRYPA
MAGRGALLRLAVAAGASERLRRAHALSAEPPPTSADVLIIGGGILGCSVALHVAQLGHSVVLLERASVGGEASGLSAGTIWDAGLPDPPAAPDLASLSFLLRSGSSAILCALRGCDFTRCGALEVGCTRGECEFLHAQYERQRAAGLAVEWLPSAAAASLAEPMLRGGSVACAVHTPLSAHVHPALATLALATAATGQGAAVREGARVTSLRREGEGEGAAYVAQLSDGSRCAARHLVVAAGAWANELTAPLGVEVPVAPVKGVVWTSGPRAPGELRKILFGVEAHLHFATHGDGRSSEGAIPAYCTHGAEGNRRARHLYGRQCGPADSHQIIFGGDRIPTTLTDYAVPEESVASLRKHVGELAPSLQACGCQAKACTEGGATPSFTRRTGLMPFSADGRPLVGECAAVGFANLWLACGFGPKGIMEGPMAGRLLAELIVAKLGARHDREHEVQVASEALQWLDPCREGGVRRT